MISRKGLAAEFNLIKKAIRRVGNKSTFSSYVYVLQETDHAVNNVYFFKYKTDKHMWISSELALCVALQLAFKHFVSGSKGCPSVHQPVPEL